MCMCSPLTQYWNRMTTGKCHIIVKKTNVTAASAHFKSRMHLTNWKKTEYASYNFQQQQKVTTHTHIYILYNLAFI